MKSEKEKQAAVAKEQTAQAKPDKQTPEQPPEEVETTSNPEPTKPEPAQPDGPLQNIWKRLKSIFPLVSRSNASS